jgi:hypothetical protein
MLFLNKLNHLLICQGVAVLLQNPHLNGSKLFLGHVTVDDMRSRNPPGGFDALFAKIVIAHFAAISMNALRLMVTRNATFTTSRLKSTIATPTIRISGGSQVLHLM